MVSKFMPQTTNEIVSCLLDGGIVLIPTDTVYGLAVIPCFQKSVDRLYNLKNRPHKKKLPVMISSIDDLESMKVDVNDCAKRLLLSSYMPGPLSLVLGFKSRPTLPWLHGRDELAIRIPDDQQLLEIIRKTGPLFVTSANKHGQSTPENLQEVLNQLDGEPDMIIEGGICKSIPSTIINCRLNPPVIERSGVISQLELFRFLRLSNV
jgi:L-threonylcarbamoyladenylate synthase